MAGVSQGADELILRRLEDAVRIKQEMLQSECVRSSAAAAAAVVEALRAGGKVLFFGNGGSSMDAGHLAAELAGRFYRDRPGLPGLSPVSYTHLRAHETRHDI